MKLDNYIKHMTHEFGKKLSKINRVLNHIIYYSDKTYFLEEINRYETIQKELEHKIRVLKAKN